VAQVPQEPPHPLLPQVFPEQFGVQLETHCPVEVLQIMLPEQVPQEPPHPLSPQAFPLQLGVHANNKQLDQLLQQDPFIQSSWPCTCPATSSFFVGAIVPIPTFPEVLARFNPPDLVCVVKLVVIGASTLSSGGFAPGSIQANTVQPTMTLIAIVLKTRPILL